MSYKTRTAGTARPTRDLTKEVPLGILAPNQWHDVSINKLTVSPTSVVVHVEDSFGDILDTRIFLREFSDNTQVSTRLKALLSAVASDSNELMTLIDGILDGELHMLGSIQTRKLRCKVGFKGTDVDIIQVSRSDRPEPRATKGNFFDD